jgi:hypothetical protein
VKYDETAAVQQFERNRRMFDAALFDRFREVGDPSSVPVFVLGMPRSGSSLIEQILASHPQVHGAGELKDLATAVRSVLHSRGRTGQSMNEVSALDGETLREMGKAYLAGLPAMGDPIVRIVDKMPGNFLNIGLIHLILPNARIIHTVRDPLDTCFSCYSKLFTAGQDFSYDLAELGRYYAAYAGMMNHWRSVLPPGAMLDVIYEDVVDDLEGQARRLIEYCGLPWDERCIRFHQTARTVRTGSVAQVRKALFRSSLQRWRRYEPWLAPLREELKHLRLRPTSGPFESTMAAHHSPGREGSISSLV